MDYPECKTYKETGKQIKAACIVILEDFSVNNFEYRKRNPKIGGSNKREMLFTKEMIASDFDEFKIIKLEEVEIELDEGLLHKELGKVIRFIGEKLP